MLETWRNHVEAARANKGVFSEEAKARARDLKTCLRAEAGDALEQLGMRRFELTRYSFARVVLNPHLDIGKVERQFMTGVIDDQPFEAEAAIDAVEDAIVQAKRDGGSDGESDEPRQARQAGSRV